MVLNLVLLQDTLVARRGKNGFGRLESRTYFFFIRKKISFNL
jgi:hypothetical protein